MRLTSTLSPPRIAVTAKCGVVEAARREPPCVLLRAITAAAVAAMLAGPPPAHAVDGCLVLLCLAAPDWRQIAQCVDPVSQMLSDLRHGRPFPHCSFSGAGNGARHDWASAPSNCPPQYTHRVEQGDSGFVDVCDYTGVVSVQINGAAWTRVWWAWGGDTVSEYSDAAKQQLGGWNTQFDDDYATWLATLPPPPVDQP